MSRVPTLDTISPTNQTPTKPRKPAPAPLLTPAPAPVRPLIEREQLKRWTAKARALAAVEDARLLAWAYAESGQHLFL